MRCDWRRLAAPVATTQRADRSQGRMSDHMASPREVGGLREFHHRTSLAGELWLSSFDLGRQTLNEIVGSDER